MPTWGSDLSGIDFDNIKYFVRSTEKQAASWDELPDDIKRTYDKLGIPEAEKQRLIAGVAAQYESEVVYHKIKDELESMGVIFTDMDSGLREHPEIVREYFGTLIPPNDNKFAALNSAVWSGGSFIYVPPGVHVDIPLQAYFRINAENMGQFERTCTTSRAARRRSTRATRSTRPWSRSSRRRTPASATRRSRTGRTTCTTSSPSARPRTRTR
jgi:Fe-S cluster assembly protein SufB